MGPDHPNVAIRLNNLALLFRATNRLAEAEPLMRRAIAILETSLGPDHPNTIKVRNNLAGLQAALGQGAWAGPAELTWRHNPENRVARASA